MTPTTTITTIAFHDLKSTATSTAEAVPSTTLATTAAHVRHPLTAEVLAWLTRRLDWEDHVDRLHERHSEDRNADHEEG